MSNLTTNDTQLFVGIDVGSTTTKIVAINPEKHEILLSDYKRHNAAQAQSVQDALAFFEDKFPNARIRLALTGSAEDQSYKPYDPPPVHQSSTAIHNLTPKHSADVTVKQGVLHLFLHNIYHQTASYNKTFLLLSTNPSSLTGKKQGGSYHKQHLPQQLQLRSL